MDEQFEKTENSMSIYYTVNKMLIALHMALLVFFVVMRVYVMVMPAVPNRRCGVKVDRVVTGFPRCWFI